eukprot:COSAG02_NODE_580_length_20059_cov_3.703908_8_plen_332_part_00
MNPTKSSQAKSRSLAIQRLHHHLHPSTLITTRNMGCAHISSELQSRIPGFKTKYQIIDRSSRISRGLACWPTTSPRARARAACTRHASASRGRMGDHGAEKDVLVKDSKKLAHSGCSAVLPFCLALIAGVPVLCVFIVLALLWKLLTWPLKLCMAKPQPRPVPEPAPVVDRPTEQLDLVLFGATGFTGNLAARYIAKTYGTKIKWGIAGRRRDALETLRAELAQTQPELKTELAILICDSSDLVQLADLVAKTKVVISTVGPFALYGSSLVAACAAAGTHYCDITGESDWVREMVDRYDDTARESGAKIVHFCGTVLFFIFLSFHDSAISL